jgi:ligand-binding sensor domain-containing protein
MHCKVLSIVIYWLCATMCISGLYARQQYSIKFFSVDDGLSEREVVDACQDKAGYVWMATNNGLNRFNGKDFVVYNHQQASPVKLPTQNITDVVEDDDGLLWIGSKQGLMVLSGDRSRLLPLASMGLDTTLFTGQPIQLEKDEAGNLYIVAGTQVYRYFSQAGRKVAEQWCKLDEPPVAGTLRTSQPGELLGLYWDLYKDKKLLVIHKNHSTATELPLSGWNRMGILHFKPDSLSILVTGVGVTTEARPLTGAKPGISAERKITDEGWLAVESYMQQDLTATFKPFNFFLLTGHLPLQRGNSLYFTNIGFFMVQPSSRYSISVVEASLAKSVRGIYEKPDGNMLISTYAGTLVVEPNGNLLRQAILGEKRIWNATPIGANEALVNLEGRGWGLKILNTDTYTYKEGRFATEAGLYLTNYIVDGRQVLYQKNRNNIFSVATLADGTHLYDFELQLYDPAATKENIILCLTKASNGDVYAGTSNGLYKLSKNTMANGSTRYSQHIINPPEVLKKTRIITMHADKNGSLWIATYGNGLVHYYPQQNNATAYTEDAGLPHNIVYSIASSNHDSTLWLGTQDGLCRMNAITKDFTNYSTANGLPSNELNTAAHCLTKNGRLYMGTINGVFSFYPDSLALQKPSPNVFCEVSIKHKTGKTRFTGSGRYAATMQPNDYMIEFEPQSNELFLADETVYRYRIANRGNQWTYIKAGNKLTMARPESGEYDFEFMAKTSGSQWGQSQLIRLNVEPPFYKTGQFNLLMVAIGLAIILIIFRWRVRGIQAEFKLKEKIANDLHDDLGGRLYAANIIASKINKTTHSTGQQNPMAERLLNITTDSYQSLRSFTWALNSQAATPQALIERMRNFADTNTRPLTGELIVEASDGIKTNKKSFYNNHQLIMAYQELLTNMVKHTESQKIHIVILPYQKGVTVRIENHYKHIKEVKTKSGGGLGNESIHKRLKTLNASFKASEANNKQQVIINIPNL